MRPTHRLNVPYSERCSEKGRRWPLQTINTNTSPNFVPCGEQKKVALSAIGKRRMKSVDKNIDKNNKQWFGCFNAAQSTRMYIFMALWRVLRPKSLLCCAYRCSYFHAHFELTHESPFVKSWVRNLCSQTKILEGRTSVSERVFEALFNGIVAQIQNSKPLKSASKTRSETLVRPSKIFVWEHKFRSFCSLHGNMVHHHEDA